MARHPVDKGKYFSRYHYFEAENDAILEREKLEDELNEIKRHEGAVLISTHVIPNTYPVLIMSVWVWE